MKVFERNGKELLPLNSRIRWNRQVGGAGAGPGDRDERRGGRIRTAFDQLLGDLHDTLMSGVRVIGGAIIPELTRFVKWIVDAAIATRDWIRDHKGLVVVALQVTGASSPAAWRSRSWPRGFAWSPRLSGC